MFCRVFEVFKKSISSNFIEGISDVERLIKEVVLIIV